MQPLVKGQLWRERLHKRILFQVVLREDKCGGLVRRLDTGFSFWTYAADLAIKAELVDPEDVPLALLGEV